MMTLAPPRPAPVAEPRPSKRATAASSAARNSALYRHDLDGLRGVAIALVAVFHVWFGKVSGGVDVFLALSGFFFGGRLLRINAEGIADFGLDGSTPVRIEALYDRVAGAWQRVNYDLGTASR